MVGEWMFCWRRVDGRVSRLTAMGLSGVETLKWSAGLGGQLGKRQARTAMDRGDGEDGMR